MRRVFRFGNWILFIPVIDGLFPKNLEIFNKDFSASKLAINSSKRETEVFLN